MSAGAPAPAPVSAQTGRRLSPRWRDGLVLAAILIGGTLATEAWRSYRNSRWAEPLAAAARPGDIRLISSVTCVYCVRAREWMTEAGVPFDECFIEQDRDCLDLYRRFQARGTPTLLVRGEAQQGFSPERVARRLGVTGG